MFKGTYRHRIDAKGRIPVPAAFRRQLAESGTTALVVTVLDECLAAYPSHEWSRVETHLSSLPPFSKPVKALSRRLSSQAVDCPLDVQGRILLPATLRAAARLEREAVVAGVLRRFEIWDPEAWAAFLVESERVLDDVSLGVPWPTPLPDTLPAPPRPITRPQGKPNR